MKLRCSLQKTKVCVMLRQGRQDLVRGGALEKVHPAETDASDAERIEPCVFTARGRCKTSVFSV
jgi:hypothetical protein